MVDCLLQSDWLPSQLCLDCLEELIELGLLFATAHLGIQCVNGGNVGDGLFDDCFVVDGYAPSVAAKSDVIT